MEVINSDQAQEYKDAYRCLRTGQITGSAAVEGARVYVGEESESAEASGLVANCGD